MRAALGRSSGCVVCAATYELLGRSATTTWVTLTRTGAAGGSLCEAAAAQAEIQARASGDSTDTGGDKTT